MIRALAISTALLVLADSGTGVRDPVTYLGVKLLPKTDLVVHGRVSLNRPRTG